MYTISLLARTQPTLLTPTPFDNCFDEVRRYAAEMSRAHRENIRLIFNRLLNAYGPQSWWPAESPTEVVIGAILTQNTAWTNVELAIANLKAANLVDWTRLRDIPETELAQLIRPAGTFRVKAQRLKAFVDHLWAKYSGSLEKMLDGPIESARTDLLSIHGIGPETADAILLYAGNRPSFVVDAYTKRILRRHFIIEPNATYDHVRDLFHQSLEPDVVTYNEYHALLVTLAKTHCRAKANCTNCPLADLPHDELF